MTSLTTSSIVLITIGSFLGFIFFSYIVRKWMTKRRTYNLERHAILEVGKHEIERRQSLLSEDKSVDI